MKLQKTINELLQPFREMATCKAMGRTHGKVAYKICEGQAMTRFGNCLSGRDDIIDAPLPLWSKP